MSKSLSYFKAVTFCLLHFALKMFYFASKSCYILRSKVVTFCGVRSHPCLCDSCCSKTSSQMCVVQTALELEPMPPGTRNDQCQSEHGRVRQHCFHSMGHISNAKQSFQLETFLLFFSTPDPPEHSYNRHFPRLLGESRCPSTHRFLRF